MTIRFVLMVNKQGQTRLAQYYLDASRGTSMEERCALEWRARVHARTFGTFLVPLA